METTYTPVQYVYREIIAEEIEKKTKGKIFYFKADETVESTEGCATELREITGKGLFILLDSGESIRIDRIITLFGKPGAAYDEYDDYANQCLSCKGGYED